MSKNLEYRIQTSGLPASEIDDEALALVAKSGGRVVLTRDGKPVAAIVNLEDLGFLLDADEAVQEDQLRSDEDPPSGAHRIRGN